MPPNRLTLVRTLQLKLPRLACFELVDLPSEPDVRDRRPASFELDGQPPVFHLEAEPLPAIADPDL